MGDLTLDIPLEGSVPFFNIDEKYDGAFRFTPRVRYETPKLSFVVGTALQIGREDALSDAKVRLFRLTPDSRLLGHFTDGRVDYRLDVPEIYLTYKPSSQWQFRLGRNYWDNTLQRRFRDWSYEGFADGNLADAGISVGPFGGDVRFHKPWRKEFPVDLNFSAAGALGGRKEALGLLQGLATFNLFDRDKMPGWVTVLGSSLGFAYYPEGSLPALLPGIAQNSAGGGLSPSVYLQQGFGEYFDLQAGYSKFLPVLDPNDQQLAPLKSRQALNLGADFHQRYWGLHANYGRVWRDDLAGVTGTKVEDQFGLSGRWMVLGDKNRALNIVLGGLATRSDDKFNFGAYAAVELSVLKFTPGKI